LVVGHDETIEYLVYLVIGNTASGIGYVKVTPGSGDNPKTKGWYEITAA
jgi:hypothetical protein